MPRKYDAKTFSKKVDEYEALVNSGSIDIPTDYSMCKFFDISPSTLKRYMEEGSSNIKSPYTEPIKKLIMLREDYYTRLGINSKNPSFAIYALKQKHNGAWTDKDNNKDQTMKLEVTVNGCKNPFA